MDSVPPSGEELDWVVFWWKRILTSERCGYEDGSKSTDSSYEWCVTNIPIVCSEICMGGIPSTVDYNS